MGEPINQNIGSLIPTPPVCLPKCPRARYGSSDCVCVCVSPSLKNIISLFLTFEYDIFLEDQERRKK